jgi:lysophospholipase L1-like esterase
MTIDFESASLSAPSVAAPANVLLTAEQARESVAHDLGEAVAANLGEEAGVAEESFEPFPEPVPEPPPVLLADASRGDETHPAAPVRPETPKPAKTIRINPEEYKGLAREIEDPSGKALDTFYASLLQTAERRAGAVTRIAHWGDSTIAADGITSTMRRRMQKRFGDAGHGFILIAKSYMPYRHEDIVHKESDGWKIYPILNDGLKDGWYGYGGVHYRSNGGASATFGTVTDRPIGTAVSTFELFYQAHPSGGDVTLQVDDGEKQVLSTRAEEQTDMWKVIEVPDGPHSLTVRAAGKGQVRLYGMALERSVPGVVYDSLGIVGARGSRLLNADPDHMARQIRHREPALLVLAFGGNEAVDRKMSITWYEGKLAEVIRSMRAGRPEASCLIMAPLDQGERDERGNVRTIPIVPKIVEAQRKIAAQEGCAFFDTFQAMGGNGAMYRWFKSKPRLGWGDFVHATPAGYEVIGNMLHKALLKGFADYVAR